MKSPDTIYDVTDGCVSNDCENDDEDDDDDKTCNHGDIGFRFVS